MSEGMMKEKKSYLWYCFEHDIREAADTNKDGLLFEDAAQRVRVANNEYDAVDLPVKQRLILKGIYLDLIHRMVRNRGKDDIFDEYREIFTEILGPNQNNHDEEEEIYE